MNVNMLEHSATQQNLEILEARGVTIVEPEEGYLACGMTGPGRLASAERIAQAVFEALGLREDMKSETVLVTAGPTEEPIDAVRYISNRSSGRMGYALAEAARRRGARVALVSGPTRLDPPPGVSLTNVRTAEEMARAVFERFDDATVVLMAAAVADFRSAEPLTGKIKKQDGVPRLALEPTPDILTEIGRRRRPGQLIVGFAAESERLIENAQAKLREKHLDLVIANDVTQEGAGFDSLTNVVTLVYPEGRTEPLEKMSKFDVANRVLDAVVEIRRAGVRFQGLGVSGKSRTP
jgi:phosphopantothenoylcysteine decarboxylase/phosphopantothenate--cysteine ligase